MTDEMQILYQTAEDRCSTSYSHINSTTTRSLLMWTGARQHRHAPRIRARIRTAGYLTGFCRARAVHFLAFYAVSVHRSAQMRISQFMQRRPVIVFYCMCAPVLVRSRQPDHSTQHARSTNGGRGLRALLSPDGGISRPADGPAGRESRRGMD
jgi:hypothetical protein